MKSKPTHCLNCGHEDISAYEFCPNCGQKVEYTRLSFMEISKDLLSMYFLVNFALFKSLKWLPIPSYLTKKYVAGQRKKFYRPFQLFIILLLIFFALQSSVMGKIEDSIASSTQYVAVEKSKLLEKFDQQFQHIDLTECTNIEKDSIRKEIFDNTVLPKADTIFTKVLSAVDSGYFAFILNEPSVRSITREELLYTPLDSLSNQLTIESKFSKFLVVQVCRIIRNPSKLLMFYYRNMIWVTILSVIFLGVLMKFFYWRPKRHFLEHALVVLNSHSFAFLVGIICFIINFFGKLPYAYVYGIIVLSFFIHFFLSIKFYYRQGWVSTWFKFWTFLFLLFFLLSIFILIVLLLSILANR